MAIIANFNFVRGKFGDAVFKQQVVRDGNGYRKATVAAPRQRNPTNPNTPAQQRQRTRFGLIQGLAGAMSNFLSAAFEPGNFGNNGYTAFISVNLARATVESGGIFYVDFRELQVTRGSWTPQKLLAYQSPNPIPPDDCVCEFFLQWPFDYRWGINGRDWFLGIHHIAIAEDGSVKYSNPAFTSILYDACGGIVKVPKCDCSKNYYYAFFYNPNTGNVTNSIYIGTCNCALPVYNPAEACPICVRPPVNPSTDPPGDCIEPCDPTATTTGYTYGVNPDKPPKPIGTGFNGILESAPDADLASPRPVGDPTFNNLCVIIERLFPTVPTELCRGAAPYIGYGQVSTTNPMPPTGPPNGDGTGDATPSSTTQPPAPQPPAKPPAGTSVDDEGIQDT